MATPGIRRRLSGLGNHRLHHQDCRALFFARIAVGDQPLCGEIPVQLQRLIEVSGRLLRPDECPAHIRSRTAHRQQQHHH
ncbi:hypothetical protein [Streptomyces sp. 061-3]|uniref:hypothetical protein n=1 Tax=Streptomyces sp. 061-3 TaxID=2789268 RepID=UPI00397F5CB4